MLKLNTFLKEKNIEFHSTEINRKVVELIENKSIPTEDNIYFFAICKIEMSSKFDKIVDD